MNSQNSKKTGVIFAIAGAIPIIWAALLAAPFLSSGLVGIIEGFTKALNNPFQVSWCEDTPRAILIFLLIYSLVH